MPTYQPAAADVHVDAALTNFSLAYMQQATNFVADKVFPALPVAKKTDKYHIFDKASFMRAADSKAARAPYGTEAPGGGFALSNDAYSCDIYRWKTDVTNDVRVNADPGINIDRSSAEYVMQSLLLLRESLWANTYFTTGVWGTDKVGGTGFTKWNDQANSDPITDIRTERTRILETTGQEANTLVVSQHVHDALVKHPMILDRYKYTSSESITSAMLAALFEVQRYMICKAVQVTSTEGATNTTSFVMGKHALLCHTANAPGLMTPSAGYNFSWSGLTGLNNMGVRTMRIPMPWLGQGTERIEGEMAFDMKATGTDLATFFSGAVD